MIYILMERHLDNEDDFGTPIFASKSQEACEKKLQSLEEEIKLQKQIAEQLKLLLDVEDKKIGGYPKTT